MIRDQKIITIFGSSYPKPGDDEYEYAYKLGYELGKAGYSICNGGYYGIMEATAKGASDSGAHTIGVTVNIFNLTVNKFIKEESQCSTLFERIEKLISLGDGYIVLKGGTGTLLELSAVLEFINKGLMEDKPIVADHEFWNDLIELMNRRNSYENRPGIKVFLSSEIDEIIKFFNHNLKVKHE